jgi:hypothetical protein
VSDLSDKERDELVAMIFGQALAGTMSVPWEDVPKFTARLERAGFVVRGEYINTDDYGRAKPVISVGLKIPVTFNQS